MDGLDAVCLSWLQARRYRRRRYRGSPQIVEALRGRDADVPEAAAQRHCYHARDRMMAGI